MLQLHSFTNSQQTLTLIHQNLFFQIHSAKKKPLRFSSRRLPKTSSSKPQTFSPKPNLRTLTSRVVELTRRKQLNQIFDEIEIAKKKYGSLNMIVMNAVVEACVRCGNVDSALRVFEEMSTPDGCGVDEVTFGTILKGLGEAQRVDEAFQLLESVEQGTAIGSPKLSPPLIYGLLNALLKAGDTRRANGLLARYRAVLLEGGPSILLYNLLMKGYTNTDCPLDAVTVYDEILRQGLQPDRLTYNALIFAFTKSGKMDAAMRLFAEMKESAQKVNCCELSPDASTYTVLLKGFGNAKDLLSVQKIVVEMKSLPHLFIDRIAYTTIVDALLNCGSTRDALCVFGEILKRAGENPVLRPKPHLYLAMMRAFSVEGDFNMVKSLRVRMLPDTVGVISPASQVEADELVMEAAINNGQVVVAKEVLSNIITRHKGMSWTSRGSMVAVRVEALSGFNTSLFSPHYLPQVSLDDPIEKYMTPFKEANPLQANMDLKKAVMRFFREAVVPVIDDWGSCVGLVHREDCNELNAPLSRMMKSPPLIPTSISIGHVINLLLEKRYKMVVIVKSSNLYAAGYSSSSKPVGVFTLEQLFCLSVPLHKGLEPS